MQRAISRLARIIIVVFAFYLLAGNVFLNTEFGPWAINRKPEKFHISWSHGLTWWPGHVALWNVKARGHVRHVVWNAGARRAQARIALLPLFGKELRVTSLGVDDVAGDVDRIDEDIPAPDYRPGGWTLRFERIATESLRRAQLMGVSLETEGKVVFAFSKQLRGGAMEILPSQIDLRATRLATGAQEWLRDASINAHFAMRRHRSAEVQGIDRLGLLDADLQIDGVPPGLVVELDPGGHLRGSLDADPAGRLKVDLALRDGRLQNGGTLDLRLPMDATRGARSSNEMAILHAAVGESDIRFTAHLPPPPEGTGAVDIDLSYAGTELARQADLRSLVQRLSGSIALDWHFESLHWIGPLLVKTPWLALSGAGRLDADLKLHNGRLVPGSRFDIPEVELAADVASHRFSGIARAQGRLEAGKDGAVANVALVLAQFDAAASDAPRKPLVRGRNLRLDLDASGDLDDFRESLRVGLRFENAEAPDLRALNAYLPGDSLNVMSGSARIDGDLVLGSDGRIERGRIGISGQRAGARLGEITLTGDFNLDARIGGSDLAKRHFDLDNTTLRLADIRVVDAGRTAGERWWANLTLKRARVEATRPLNIDASADIELQNVGLLLALFTRHSDYPRWALKLADAGSLRASGRLQMRDRALVFDRVEARNDRFDIKARLRIAKARTDGDLLLRWRALGLGLELESGKREFHFLRAADWYQARKDLLAN